MYRKSSIVCISIQNYRFYNLFICKVTQFISKKQKTPFFSISTVYLIIYCKCPILTSFKLSFLQKDTRTSRKPLCRYRGCRCRIFHSISLSRTKSNCTYFANGVYITLAMKIYQMADGVHCSENGSSRAGTGQLFSTRRMYSGLTSTLTARSP